MKIVGGTTAKIFSLKKSQLYVEIEHVYGPELPNVFFISTYTVQPNSLGSYRGESILLWSSK